MRSPAPPAPAPADTTRYDAGETQFAPTEAFPTESLPTEPASAPTTGPRPPQPGPPGLSSAEAAQRLKLFGRNSLEDLPGQSAGALLVGALRHTLALLLLAAAALYTAMGDVMEGFFLIACAALYLALAIVQQIRRDRVRVDLHRLAEPTARVRRDGRPQRLPRGDLVPGDLLALREGESMPADGVLLSDDPITVDETAANGNTTPTSKLSAGRAAAETLTSAAWTPEAVAQTWTFAPSRAPTTVLLRGTVALRGRAFVQIAATGAAALGRPGPVQTLLDDAPGALQSAAGQLTRRLSLAAICFCVLATVVTGLFQDSWYLGGLAGIALALALVPQDFPLLLALLLSLAARRLSRARVLARRGEVLETLGATTVLCVGKTGLITHGRLMLAALREGGTTLVLAPGVPPPERALSLLRLAMYAAAPESNDPMDRAILTVTDAALPAHGARLMESFARRRDLNAMIQHWRAPARGGDLFAAKGAPEAIARLCHLDGPARAAMERDAADFAAHGLQVLAVAYRQAALDVPTPKGTMFTFAGLIGFSDPMRPDVPQAMGEARHAGIKVLLVTGDHPATAREIARQAGIDTTAGVLTGAEIAQLTPEALAAQVRDVRVFARVQPDQKAAIVQALRSSGEVVAIVGDKTGDVPALEAAQIGIALSRRAPDAVRNAAGLVLLDDRFSSVVTGIRTGRRIFGSLRRALIFIAAVHGAVAGLALIPVLMGLPPMLYPAHVVLLALIADPLAVLVFQSESGSRFTMAQPPRAASEALFGGSEMILSLLQGFVLLVAVLGLYIGVMRFDHPPMEGRACAVLALLLALPILAFSSSSEPGAPFFRRQRKLFWAISAMVMLLVCLLLLLPQVAAIFRLAPLSPAQIVLVVVIACVAGCWSGLLRRFASP